LRPVEYSSQFFFLNIRIALGHFEAFWHLCSEATTKKIARERLLKKGLVFP
jgi:hypothetical protein